MANRTKKGNVTSSARKKHGNKQGKFPIFDEKSCKSAVKLRGHGNKAAVLNKASKWANAHGSSA